MLLSSGACRGLEPEKEVSPFTRDTADGTSFSTLRQFFQDLSLVQVHSRPFGSFGHMLQHLL
jgi:hypothetical protein